MILNSKETTLAYRCPGCGKMVFGVAGIFSLSGDLFKLKCPCGYEKSVLSARYTRDRKVNIEVPCIICGNKHSFTVSSDTFFGRDVFGYSCPYSAIELCLLGKEEEVKKEAEKADEKFLELLKEAGIDDYDTFSEAKSADDEKYEEKYPDPELQSAVHFMLCELEDEHNIKCRCSEGGHYEFKFVGNNLDNVLIYCTECNASVTVPLSDPMAIDNFLRIDKLRLT